MSAAIRYVDQIVEMKLDGSGMRVFVDVSKIEAVADLEKDIEDKARMTVYLSSGAVLTVRGEAKTIAERLTGMVEW